MFQRLEFLIAKRFLRSASSGVLSFLAGFSILGVFLGVATLIFVIGLMRGYQEELKRRMLMMRPHVQIIQMDYTPIAGYQEILNALKDYDEVVTSTPFVMVKCLIRHGDYWDGVILAGIDPKESIEARELQNKITMGRFDLGENKVLINYYTAVRLRVVPGDTVVFYTVVKTNAPPPFDFTPVSKKAIVAGVFNADFMVAPYAYTNISDAQKLAGIGDKVHGISIIIKDPYKAREMAQKLAESYQFPFIVTNWIDDFRSLFSALKLERLAMYIVLSLMVVIASFGIISTLTIMITEKTREIGVLRSLGVTSQGIMRIFMLVGIFIGAIGAVLGGIFSVTAGFLIDKYHIIKLPPEVYMVESLPFKLNIGDAALVVSTTFIIVVLSTIYPSIKAAKLLPVEAIKYE